MVGNAHPTFSEIYMSEELRNKLRFHRELKEIKKFFAQISELEVLQYNVRSTGFAKIEAQLQEFSEISSIPYSRIPISSSVDVIEEWLRANLAESKIQSPVYLRMSNYWSMGWTQVETKDLGKSLTSIWNLEKSVQIVVTESLSFGKSQLLISPSFLGRRIL